MQGGSSVAFVPTWVCGAKMPHVEERSRGIHDHRAHCTHLRAGTVAALGISPEALMTKILSALVASLVLCLATTGCKKKDREDGKTPAAQPATDKAAAPTPPPAKPAADPGAEPAKPAADTAKAPGGDTADDQGDEPADEEGADDGEDDGE
jgi:hypothetical protein